METLSSLPYFLPVTGIVPCTVHLKLEALCPTGSIKLKTAESLIANAEREGIIQPEARIIESSSGNLGIALASVCARRGYKFVCVVDPNIARDSVKIMKALGAEVIEVNQRDDNGGYLGTRIKFVRKYLEDNPGSYWTNQYANPANPQAHEVITAPEILKNFPNIDLLVVGAGTTGTLMGCISYFRKHRPQTKILAVDSAGSVTFDKAGTRFIPGLGTSRIPEIFDKSQVSHYVIVPEEDTIAMCRRVAFEQGYLAGGSTGTILAGLAARSDLVKENSTVVAISPDGGEKYLDTIYDDTWVSEKFGEKVLGASGTKKPSTKTGESSEVPQQPPMSVVTGVTVKEILERSAHNLTDIVARTYVEHADGKTINPDSYFLRYPDEPLNRIIALPAAIKTGASFLSGIKWIASFPKNVDIGLARASAVIILNNNDNGYPFTVMEGGMVSSARTAASAVLAANSLYVGSHRRAVEHLSVIGSGIIAKHIVKQFIASGWTVGRLTLHDLSKESANGLSAQLSDCNNISEIVIGSLQDALNAKIIVFATSAGQPYVPEDFRFKANQLILNISLRDIHPAQVLSSYNIFDDIDHCMKANTSPHLAEQMVKSRDFVTGTIAEVLKKRLTVPTDKPIIYSPFGMGILDIALAKYVYDIALRDDRVVALPDFFGECERWLSNGS